ncbi:MotA/TolQ/ExbB proton channel family protein [Bdellovibrionota bacterium FG-1]
MITLPLGSLIMAAVLAFALGDMNPKTLLNMHSIILVFVGTIGVLGISSPGTEIVGLFKSLWALKNPDVSRQVINQGLRQLSRKRDAVVKKPHSLIGFAQNLWAEGHDPEIFGILLQQRVDELNSTTEQAVATIRNLAKYPPALGMTGTVIGLVSLFSGLTPDRRGQLGPSLALAMTATFYGLILSNVFLMPLADRIYVQHLRKSRQNEHICQVLMLIHQGESPDVIEEELGGHAA